MMKEVQETWWHRLLTVTLIFIWIAFTAIAALGAWNLAGERVFIYNWHLPYKNGTGELGCEPFIYQDESTSGAAFRCGQFTGPTEAIDDMIKVGFIPRPDQLPSPRTEVSDAKTLQSIARKHPLKYRMETVHQVNSVIRNVGVATLLSLAAAFLLILFSKLVFFVAYGSSHRIVR